MQVFDTADQIKPVTYVRNFANSSWSSWIRIYDESMLTNPTLLSPLAAALGVPTITSKHEGTEMSFLNFVKNNTFEDKLYMGMFHPNMYSFYIMLVQDGTKISDGCIKWGQGIYIYNGILYSFNFLNGSYTSNKMAVDNT